MSTQYDVYVDGERGYLWDEGYTLKQNAFKAIDDADDILYTAVAEIPFEKSRLVVVETVRTVVTR